MEPGRGLWPSRAGNGAQVGRKGVGHSPHGPALMPLSTRYSTKWSHFVLSVLFIPVAHRPAPPWHQRSGSGVRGSSQVRSGRRDLLF